MNVDEIISLHYQWSINWHSPLRVQADKISLRTSKMLIHAGCHGTYLLIPATWEPEVWATQQDPVAKKEKVLKI